MKCGIYEIRNTLNNHRYIGSSKDANRRLSDHRNKLKKGNHHNCYLQNAWNKYGPEVFVFCFLVESEPEHRFITEQEYFNKYKPEYNITKKAQIAPPALEGDGLARLSAAQKEIKGEMSLEEHKQWSEKCHRAKAKKRSTETVEEQLERTERMSKPHRGKKFSKEHKQKISLSQKKNFEKKTPKEINRLVDQMNRGKIYAPRI